MLRCASTGGIAAQYTALQVLVLALNIWSINGNP